MFTTKSNPTTVALERSAYV